MFKLGALAAAILLLVSMPFAETYSKQYVSGGWLEVTRTIDVGVSGSCPLQPVGVSDVCAHSGARQAGSAGGTVTKVTLTLKNIGPQDRSYVSVGESLSYVPSGADITFSPSPSQFDGRQAVWEIASIARGEERALSYEFGSSVTEAAVGRIPDAAAAAAPSTVVLYAPSRLQVNGTLTLSLKSAEGKPISGARIMVGYPDGSTQAVKTDNSGTVSLTASRKGSYTYSVEGYDLYQLVSPVAEDKGDVVQKSPATAASAADAGLLPGIIGALPILAGIFAVAVVALITYNFLAARREEDESSSPAPELAERQAESANSGMSYTQKFSFGEEAERERKMDDATRGMVESRKRRMQEEAPKQPEEEPEKQEELSMPEEAAGESTSAYETGSERTVANGDMDSEIAELERNARIAGEVAEQEKEVENMLSQLEEIRNKLRAGRGEMDAEAEKPEEPRKPRVPPQAMPRKAAPSQKQKAAAKKRK